MMYEVVKRLYQAGKLTHKGVQAAVLRGWITQEQASALLEPVPPDPADTPEPDQTNTDTQKTDIPQTDTPEPDQTNTQTQEVPKEG